MKIKITFTKGFSQLWKEIKQDYKLFGTDQYYKENHHKHFNWSLLIGVLSIAGLTMLTDIEHTGVAFQTFAAGFIALAVNFAREAYFNIFHKAPTSWPDVRFGTYGGIIGGLITAAIIYFLY